MGTFLSGKERWQLDRRYGPWTDSYLLEPHVCCHELILFVLRKGRLNSSQVNLCIGFFFFLVTETSWNLTFEQSKVGRILNLRTVKWHWVTVSHSGMSDSLQPLACSLPGSSVHGISQPRILGWVPIPFSRESYHPGIEPGSPALQGRFFTVQATREAQWHWDPTILGIFCLKWK